LHIWLDPHNAMAMARAISAALEAVDPAHQDRYRHNTAVLLERLRALDQELTTQLAPVRNKPYLVFHDAYHYFEQRYGLSVVGSLTVSPEQKPGARRIKEIRDRIGDNRVLCVFSEPQFDSALVNTLLEDTSVKRGVLDPLGTDLAAGTDAYFQLLRNLAASLTGCLGS